MPAAMQITKASYVCYVRLNKKDLFSIAVCLLCNIVWLRVTWYSVLAIDSTEVRSGIASCVGSPPGISTQRLISQIDSVMLQCHHHPRHYFFFLSLKPLKFTQIESVPRTQCRWILSKKPSERVVTGRVIYILGVRQPQKLWLANREWKRESDM